ncbi:MAG TPA: LysE family translocator [Vicinamibacterales bacterium]|nr:LysE family translocator [Vicinamibacterales bacterium]
MHPNLWAFAAFTVPFVMSPGASTALVLRNSVAGGIRAGVETAVGVNAGSVCYGLLTAFGVALLLQRFPLAWTTIRVAGAAYLCWLGGVSVARALTGRGTAPAVAARRERRPLARNLAEGFVTNMLNPSIAAFYLLIVAQFVPRAAPIVASVLMLTAMHVSLALTWHLSWATAGGTLATTLSRSGPRRALEAVMGIALLAIAAKVALTA